MKTTCSRVGQEGPRRYDNYLFLYYNVTHNIEGSVNHASDSHR